MCGIAGILNLKNQVINNNMIRQMTCAMSHRGPDSDGYYIENEIALGHRRLSIIDLSTAANQPYTDNTERYVMVFNGEMYNFQEVKSLLSDYNFLTTGDTEVLIAAFAKWGVKCVNYFKGMFAFAVWDKVEKQLTIVRDRLGVKPLYYYIDDYQFLFASEVRAILSTEIIKRKINRSGLLELLSYQSVGYPFTLIEGINQLEAGNYATIKNGRITAEAYWKITDSNVDFDYSNENKVKAHIRTLLSGSVRNRLISDVPIGAFLSGGIDSSVIVGLMVEVSSSKPNTFTVSFNEKEFDESKYAEIIAKKFNTNHTNIQLEPTSFLEELENALNAMDTPSGDGINSYIVSKAIRQAGMTVALSGIGGDELFAGYPLFNRFINLNNKKSLWKGTSLLRKLAAVSLNVNASNKNFRIQQIIKANTPSIENIYPVLRQIMAPQLISRLTTITGDTSNTALSKELHRCSKELHRLPLLSQVSAAEYMGYTQHTLLKDMDQMSMAVSLEVREPFFDHSLIEFVLSIPDNIKNPVYPKSLLVESVASLLPDKIVHRKKQGFLLPWSIWMKNELKEFCEKRIKNLSQRSFINSRELMKYWNRFLKNDVSVRWTELWIFVVLEYWMEKNYVTE